MLVFHRIVLRFCFPVTGCGSANERGGEEDVIALGGKFAAKPDGADGGRILVARAACRKRLVRDGHAVVGGLAAESAKTKGIFADCSDA